jgi:hypothetical protein
MLSMPVFVIPGNHDAREPLRAAFRADGYLSADGHLHYAVEDYPLRLVALDTLVDASPRNKISGTTSGVARWRSKRCIPSYRSGGAFRVAAAVPRSAGLQQMKYGAAVFRKLSRYNRPAALLKTPLPFAQRVVFVADFPLMSPRWFCGKLFSPQQFFHREILPCGSSIEVYLRIYLKSHIRDRYDQIFSATVMKHRKDRADAFPLDMLERLAAQNRVVPRNFMTLQIAEVLLVVRDIRTSERPRPRIERVDVVTDIDEHAGNQPKRGPHL